MGTAALGQPRESGLKSYVSRGSAAILALVLHGAVVYLLAGYLGVVRIPQPPSVEPILASLIVQPRSVPATSRLPAMSPTDLIKPAYLPPDTPPNFRIDVPVEAPPAQKPSEPQLGDGSPSPRGLTDEPGEGTGIAVLHHVQPVYSAAAEKAYEHGTVELRVLVDEQGRPSEVRLLHSSGSTRLDESATNAVQRYRFTRPVKGSQAVRAWTTVTLEFELLPMPVPTTIVGFDSVIAEQIAAAKRTNPGLHRDLPEADAIIVRLANNLLHALSSARAVEADPQHARSSPTPIQLLAMWGKLTSVRFQGLTSRGFASDMPLTEDRPATTGSRLGGSATVRCEIFEVKQVGGVSYWLAVVGNDGRLKSLEITVTTEPEKTNDALK
jgi:periplasmic protein TonB